MTSPAPLSVLIAEDEVLVSMFLADVVEDAGLRVAGVARTVQDAIAKAEADPPDLALLDMNLKGGSGLEVARALATHGTAVLFISGDPGIERDPAVQAVRPAAVLEKPCMPDRLIEALQQVAAELAAVRAP
ncbi:response regulator [Paracoccus aeridis]|uniref:response regulator n=1 Tax=Paracoccus aeridis TaxID=1966466 RepID=UPI0010AA457B|nr:response regulator [Paracoccus aeridis]